MQKSRMAYFFLCLLRYSIHITVHVPPYMATCVHLSINGTLSSGVLGGVTKHNIHITAMRMHDTGYFLIK